MIVVDIRNTRYQRNIEIIGLCNNCIYYYEEKIEGDILYLILFEYNITTNQECIIKAYVLNNKEFIIHPILLEDFIYLVLEDGKEDIWIFKIDKETRMEVSKGKFKCDGEYVKCEALNNRYLLVSTKGKDRSCVHETDLRYNFYLYDTENQKVFLSRNKLFEGVDPLDIKVFKENNMYHVLALRKDVSLGDRSKLLKSVMLVCSNVLIDNVMSESGEELSLQCVFQHEDKGSFEIVGEDSKNIYFIFESIFKNDIRLCSYNKKSKDVNVVKHIKILENKLNKYHINNNPFKIYMTSNSQNGSKLEGVYNCKINTEFNPRYGEFIDCVEDRFIICRNTLCAPDNTQEEYITIYDDILKTEECFKAKCFVSDEKVFLY